MPLHSRFLSRQLIQAHELNWDAVDIGGLLYVYGQGLPLLDDYPKLCGEGIITCDLNEAKDNGIALGLSGDDPMHTQINIIDCVFRGLMPMPMRLRLCPMPHKLN